MSPDSLKFRTGADFSCTWGGLRGRLDDITSLSFATLGHHGVDTVRRIDVIKLWEIFAWTLRNLSLQDFEGLTSTLL